MANTSTIASPDLASSRKRRRRLYALIAVVIVGSLTWHLTTARRAATQALSVLEQNPAEAERLMAAIVEDVDPADSRAWLIRARALLRLGRRDEAAGCLALLKPGVTADEELLVALAEEALTAGIPTITTRCTSMLPDQSEMSLRVARLLLKQPPELLSDDRRRAALVALSQSHPTGADDWQLIVQARQLLDDLPAELQAYRDAVRTIGDVPASTPFRQQLAERLIQLGEFVEAKPLVEQLTQGDEPMAEDRIRLAQVRRFEGRRMEAIEQLDKVLAQDANYVALLLRGTIWSDEHDYERAESDLSAAIQRNSKHAESHYRLALVLKRLGKENEAKTHFAEHARLSAMQLEVLEVTRQLQERPQDTKLIERLIELNLELGFPHVAARWEKRLRTQSQ